MILLFIILANKLSLSLLSRVISCYALKIGNLTTAGYSTSCFSNDIVTAIVRMLSEAVKSVERAADY